MSRYFAWEAAHLYPDGRRPYPRVHAVAVIEVETPDGSLRRGDRNTATFCGLRIGQWNDEYAWRDEVRLRPQLQLHRAAELTHLERCHTCLRRLEAKRQRGRGEAAEEWVEDMSLFPGTPIRMEVPCAAPWPVYYRYRVEGSETTSGTGYWLPDESWVLASDASQDADRASMAMEIDSLPAAVRNAGLAAEMVEGIARRLMGDGVPLPAWRREVNASIEWHRPRRLGQTPAEVRRDREREIARAREEAQREQRAALERGDSDALLANVRAMTLLIDVVGVERAERMSQLGYLDLESMLFRDSGYRIRPWRRVGLLRRRADGEWEELKRSWCIHPDELYPMMDEVVTLYLSLRYDEMDTLAKANMHYEAA